MFNNNCEWAFASVRNGIVRELLELKGVVG